MASCIAVARQPLFALSKRGFGSVYTASNLGRRTLHASPVALKKKVKVEIEELFSDDLGEDLLSIPDTTPSAPAESNTSPQPTPSKRLKPVVRHTRFEELYKNVLPHLNPNRKERQKLPPMRYTVWTHLLDLAQNEDELRRVIELAPKWKDVNRDKKDKGGLGPQWGEMVVTRAESLTCPQVALDMFSDHAKYQVPLSLPAARHLLHALHTKHSLEQVMTAVALYRVYNLTPIADDLVSLGLVCRALAGKIHPTQPPPASKSAVPAKPQALKPKTLQASKQVFQALIESLRELVSSTDPSLYSISSHARTRSLTPKFSERQERANKGVAALEKEKTWLKWCLQRIESNLRKTEDLKKINWLTQWRVAAGHIKAEPVTV